MKRSIFKLSSALALLALTPAVPATVHAQPEASPPVATTAVTSGAGAGLGVGAATFVAGLTGLDVVYDMRRFHVEGLLGFSSLDAGANRTETTFQFGARGWYHLHVGTNSDFSLGGGLGVRTASGVGASLTATLVEPGMQARVFLTPNFALNLTGGLTIVFGDSFNNTSTVKGFGLATQLLGGVGFTYFFR